MEKVLEEKMSEEKLWREEVAVDERKEDGEREIVGKKDEVVQTDDDIDGSSSDSLYSYSTCTPTCYFALYHATYLSRTRNLFRKSRETWRRK